MRLVRSAKKLIARVSVSPSGQATCGTKVRVVLTRAAKVVGARTVPVNCAGKATAVLTGAQTNKRATYTVTALYRGSAALAPSRARTTARR